MSIKRSKRFKKTRRKMELLNKKPEMNLSVLADALHEIAVDLKKHSNIKQETNVEEETITKDDDDYSMVSSEEEEKSIDKILNNIEDLLKKVLFTKAIGSQGNLYEINLEKMTCTCPAFVYNPNPLFICKHLKKSLKYKQEYEKNFKYPKLSELSEDD